MDLEALLLCPKLEASALFYKTKLGVHNFTLFNMAEHSVMCYVWHEGQGGLNANEFARFIMDYLKKHDDYDEYIVWSDGCGYQNRNTTLSNALLNIATARCKTITQKEVTPKWKLIRCSVIERKLKNKEIHCPADYISVMKTARKHPAPYVVVRGSRILSKLWFLKPPLFYSTWNQGWRPNRQCDKVHQV